MAIPVPKQSGGVRKRLAGYAAQDTAHTRCSRGGVKQRISSQDDDSTSNVGKCATPFNDAMRRDWSNGSLSAKQVLEYAYKAGQQGACNLNGLGKYESLKHANRDLTRVLGWPDLCPEITWLDVPRAGGFLRPHPVIRPTSIFESLLAKDEEKLNRMIRGPPGAISEFWNNMEGHCITENIRIWIGDQLVPITIHGDGAATHKTEGLLPLAGAHWWRLG